MLSVLLKLAAKIHIFLLEILGLGLERLDVMFLGAKLHLKLCFFLLDVQIAALVLQPLMEQ